MPATFDGKDHYQQSPLTKWPNSPICDWTDSYWLVQPAPVCVHVCVCGVHVCVVDVCVCMWCSCVCCVCVCVCVAVLCVYIYIYMCVCVCVMIWPEKKKTIFHSCLRHIFRENDTSEFSLLLQSKQLWSRNRKTFDLFLSWKILRSSWFRFVVNKIDKTFDAAKKVGQGS